MEGFQTKIQDSLGVSVPGTNVEAAGTYSVVDEGIAADDNVKIGSFVFRGVKAKEITGFATAGAIPIGVVMNSQYFSGNVTALGLAVPKGSTVGYREKGIIAVAVGVTEAKVGESVNVDPTTGVITTGTPAAGAIDTLWKVRQAAPANGVMFIIK